MKRVAESSVRRLSLYLRSLERAEGRGQATISSQELAQRGGTTSAQVRKDLSAFGSFGKRGLGYPVADLAATLRGILGVGRQWRVVIVGAGKVGSALAAYGGFRARGFRVVGVFDADPERVGRTLGGSRVRGMAHFDRDIRALKPHIAVVTVPADAAQGLVDRLGTAGVSAVLNFAPVAVRPPRGLLLRSVDMASELEVLAFALAHREGPRRGSDPTAD